MPVGNVLMKKNNNNTYQLAGNDIHLWMINPKHILASDDLFDMLSPAENEKIARYRSDKAKHTALITRTFIRLLLSQYDIVTPQSWQFTHNELGKPEVSNATITLRFNLSHNDEMIICAICLEKDIGCDIEKLNRKISVNAIAKRFFAESEYQLIKTSPKQFFEYWTLKEAFVKATGLGISQGLDTFSFKIEENNNKALNDNISLTFAKNCKESNAQHWYHALLKPDEQHCIGISINNKKQTDKKPNIRLFSIEDSLALYTSN